MSIFKKATLDTLEEKKKALDTYTETFNGAVSVITGMIDTMDAMSTNIETTIKEIEDYQSALEETKEGLMSARDRNSRVIKNFKVLLEVE